MNESGRREFQADTAGNPLMRPLRLAFYLPDLAGGGAERLTLILCEALAARGHEIELVLDRCVGENTARIPSALRVHELLAPNARVSRLIRTARRPRRLLRTATRALASSKPYFAAPRITSLADYLESRRPDLLLSALGYAPFVAYWARQIADTDTRLIHAEHNTPSRAFLADHIPLRRLVRLEQTKGLAREIYPRLEAIVGVSDGVSEDTAEFAQIQRAHVHTIYNPIPLADIRRAAGNPATHPWLSAPSGPLVVTAGRLVPQKNFPLLLTAFARLLQLHADVRLIILGDGPMREPLNRQAEQLGLAERIDMPGWLDNPYAFMAAADVFVQSSDREGLSTVLIEALACGCPIVATDCKSGPREILADGEYGTIVPMHDAPALAQAMSEAIVRGRMTSQRLIERALSFSVERSAEAYERLFNTVLSAGKRTAGRQS